MVIITSKAKINALVNDAMAIYRQKGSEAFIANIHRNILKQKVRFPLLETAAGSLYEVIPDEEQLHITDDVINLGEIGSYVLAGMILQLRLYHHYAESIDKATEYIIQGDAWYVCDIIGERAMGFALLNYPEKTIPVLRKLSAHSDKWIVRSVGVATHYAVKKGLKKVFVEEVFQLLLSLADTTDFHTKKGIGWGAKTIAKFYPDIIQRHVGYINTHPGIRLWFKTKIRIGLGRSFKYATRYPG